MENEILGFVSELRRYFLIQTKKTIYDKAEDSDGERILVMRYWPRGVPKSKIDLWIKELGTEPELIRKWKAKKISWAEFKREYKKSLKGKEQLLEELARKAKNSKITLLCSCKDAEKCHRTVLASEVEKILKEKGEIRKRSHSSFIGKTAKKWLQAHTI